MGQVLLLLMLFTPLVAALLVLGLGSRRWNEVRQVTLLATLISLGCAVGIAVNYRTPVERPGAVVLGRHAPGAGGVPPGAAVTVGIAASRRPFAARP